METSAKYAYQVYKKGSFTKAAQELYVSQPSLSAAISRLEEELGFRIFDRSTIPCSLTSEGRIYIDSLEEIIEAESNMKKRIRELSDVDRGSISVGGSSFSSYLILSEICKEFHKRYPNMQVTLDIGNTGSSQVLHEKLGNREIDILITYSDFITNCICVPYIEERMVIAMNKNMPGAERVAHLALTREEVLTRCYSPEREIEDTSIFDGIEFLEFPRESDTTRKMGKLLGAYKPSRYVIQNARHSEMHYNLMRAGIGAALITSLAIEQKPYDEDILFFIPKSAESYRKIYLAYNYASKHNRAIKDFIGVAKDIFKE